MVFARCEMFKSEDSHFRVVTVVGCVVPDVSTER